MCVIGIETSDDVNEMVSGLSQTDESSQVLLRTILIQKCIHTWDEMTMQTHTALICKRVFIRTTLNSQHFFSSSRHRWPCSRESSRSNDSLGRYEWVICVQGMLTCLKHVHMKHRLLSYIRQNFIVSYSLCLYSPVFVKPWCTFEASEQKSVVTEGGYHFPTRSSQSSIIGFAVSEPLTIDDW
jgi:hypothetical protein